MTSATQDKILIAAEKRMLPFGYRKVTMDDIAGDLKMSKNTIYKHFPGKMDIAAALLNRIKDNINQHQLEVEERYTEPLEILSQNTFYLQRELAPWYGQFLADIKTELPHLWDDFVRFRTEKILDIENVIKRGIKKKAFRKVNPTIAARAYLGAVNSILSPDVLDQEGVSFQSALAAIMDIWSQGILHRK
jgi:AcrR family transcriptional regulator